jgi:hypothetical protein
MFDRAEWTKQASQIVSIQPRLAVPGQKPTIQLGARLT